MKWALVLTAAGLFAPAAAAQAPAASKTHKVPATHATGPHASAKRTGSGAAHTGAKAGSGSVHATKGKHTTKGKPRSTGPALQNHPEPERYREIQQALSERGYFDGEANGAWGADSQDALLRFQTDKKLDADGKITALTLENLGLGPKHDGTSTPLSGPKPERPAGSEIPALNAPTPRSAQSVRPARAEGTAQTPGQYTPTPEPN